MNTLADGFCMVARNTSEPSMRLRNNVETTLDKGQDSTEAATKSRETIGEPKTRELCVVRSTVGQGMTKVDKLLNDNEAALAVTTKPLELQTTSEQSQQPMQKCDFDSRSVQIQWNGCAVEAVESGTATTTDQQVVDILRTRGGTANIDESNGGMQRSTRKRKASDEPIDEGKGKTNSISKVVDDAMLWICGECREAECMEDSEAVLMICDGKCKRAFHSHCCGMNESGATSEESWFCSDCFNKKHRCALCQEYGNDDDDVFLCDKKECGMFFHESCLRMQNVDVRLIELPNVAGGNQEILQTSEDGSAIATRPVFTCPAHSCWTCTEEYIPEEEDENGKVTSSKKRKRKTRTNANFLSKKDTRLYQCLECPIAYHISCIPPLCRFHELALLCHDHSSSHKLPDLDVESSMQGQVEAEIDKKLEKILLNKVTRTKKARVEGDKDDGVNAFFVGLRGDGITASEIMLFEELDAEKTSDAAAICMDRTLFCLPCDFKEEVHAKPPPYKHLQTLRYDPLNKPKRNPATGESCECHKKGDKVCEELCLNRMVMIECVGDKDKGNGEKNAYWNCNVGPSCGNRQMGQRAVAKCKPKREQGKGWGLVSINGIKKGGLVQEYVGEIIDEKTKESRLVDWGKDHPSDPNFYIMQLETGWYIDARLEGNLSRFINHSCDPNCHLVQTSVNGFARVGIFALQDIAPDDFLSYDYQFDTKDGDKFVCRCGAAKCRGTMKGGKHKATDNSLKSAKDIWNEAKLKYDRDVKFLEEVERVEASKFSQVDVLVPGADFSHELVSSGPTKKKAVIGRTWLFLWRNAVVGSDFARRSRQTQTRKPCPNKTLSKVDVLSMLMKDAVTNC